MLPAVRTPWSRIAKLVCGCVALGVISACTPRSSAPPPQPAAPSELVRGQTGLNATAQDVCARPCDASLHPSVSTVRPTTAAGTVHVELDPAICRVPGHGEEPQACSAVCVDQGDGVPVVKMLLVDMGPIGPNTRAGLCRALERDRGAPARGSCDDVCESGMGCGWPQTPERRALEFVGHIELQCSSDVEPNQSDGSNSMSP